MKFPSYPECAARDAFRSLPRLGMDEYVAFLAESMVGANPEKVARQKAVEERITVPFRLVHDEEGAGETCYSPPPANSRTMKIELSVTSHARQQENDRAYWCKQTGAQRLDMVETLRMEAGKFLYEYPTRLRRVVKVTRKT